MDELTFQHQLQELKQRVSDMAATSGSWVPPRPHAHPGLAPSVAPNYHQDLYTAQLHDVRLKLDRMQANLPTPWLGPEMQTNVPSTAMPAAPETLESIRRDLQKLTGTMERNLALGKEGMEFLKSGFANIRDEMHKGFANLKHTVSEVRRDTSFTPGSSEATVEDLTAAREGFPADSTAVPNCSHCDLTTTVLDKYLMEPLRDTKPPHTNAGQPKNRFGELNNSGFFEPPPSATDWSIGAMNRNHHLGDAAIADDTVPETRHDGHFVSKGKAGPLHICPRFPPNWQGDRNVEGPKSAFLQGRYTGFEGVAQRIQETCPRPAVLSEPFMAVCPPRIVPDPDFERLSNLPKLPSSCDDTGTKGRPGHEHDNTTEDKKQHEDAWSHLDTSSAEKTQLKIEQITHQQLRDAILAKDEVIADLEVGQIADRRDMAEKDATITHLSDWKAAADITKLDLEQRLDEAKHRHSESENEILRLKEYAEAARRSFSTTEQTRFELQQAAGMEIERLRHDLKQCEASRHHFMTKYVDENYRFKWLEQKKLQSEQRLQQQLEECEAALEKSYNRETYFSNTLRSRNEELDNLHVFCEEKDAVVHQQEQIIAQGASILQERDAEIDRLSAALEDTKRSEQDAREHAAKNKRTIQKRDLQLEDLHREARGEKDRRCRLEDLMRRDAEAMRTKAKDVRFDADEQGLGRSFANAGNATANLVSRSQSGRQNPLWTPQPIPSSGRLPHEGERAWFWEDGKHATAKHKFGSPSPIVQRRSKSGRDQSNDKSAAHEHDNHIPSLLSNHVTVETPRGQHHQLSAMHPDPSRHQSEPLGSNQEALQLLAGWTERTLQEQQKNSRLHEQQPLGPPQLARQTHADMSHQRPAASGGGGGGRRSPSSRMKAQALTNGGFAENGRRALPLDTTWSPAAARPAVMERVGSVPDLSAGSRSTDSRNHASREHSAMSKPASMFNLRPQKRHMPSPQQTYRAPSVETEAESSSADEREQQRQRNSLADYS